jgi:hypothetical protein
MAGLVINDVSYPGQLAAPYWTPAVFASDTVSKGVVNVIDSIKKQINIRNIDVAYPWQPRAAMPTTSATTVTLDKKLLVPQDAMVYMPFNPRDLEVHWEAENLSKLLLERKLPATFESYLLYMLMGRAFEQLETNYWMGSTNYQVITDETDNRYQLQFFDGFMKTIVNDSSVLNYSAPATITTSNVFTFMDGLISLIATNKKALITNAYKKRRMKFIMSVNTELIYMQALTTGTSYKGTDYSSGKTPDWKGYPVVTTAGFPDNTILFIEAAPDFDTALHIGVNSKDDENTLEMKKLRPEGELYYVKLLTKIGTQIKYGNEIACCTTLTTSSFTV